MIKSTEEISPGKSLLVKNLGNGLNTRFLRGSSEYKKACALQELKLQTT